MCKNVKTLNLPSTLETLEEQSLKRIRAVKKYKIRKKR